MSKLRLMTVLAHPDDESLGMGGTLAKYSREGVDTYLITATRGERGRYGDLQEFPGLEAVGQIREKELRMAAKRLGITEVHFLDYIDGDLDKAEPLEAIAKITYYIRKYRPQVVVTFGPEGGYGHPDHIAICQYTTAATICAADPDFNGNGYLAMPSQHHAISKLYYMAWTQPKWDAYQAAFRKLVTVVDGVERQVTPAPDWGITSRIDTSSVWEIVWEAVSCHKTQLAIYGKLKELSAEHHMALWGTQEFYRAFSRVNGKRALEQDLFEGLR
ncbi:MAG: PIG-L family deacetylase [bacterium]|jgi:LmbE family N-acetylglucosaminyl deacetylase